MKQNADDNISKLIEELDSAIQLEDIQRADALTDILFRLQGGADTDTAMPERFHRNIALRAESGGYIVKQKSLKRLITIAVAAVLVLALGITALATRFFGISDLVITESDDTAPPAVLSAAPAGTEPDTDTNEIDAPTSDYDMIALQGYPDSNEYKASAEWNLFCQNYDTDNAILNQVGNSSNEYTEKYPMYLVYSKDMADKLEEIVTKYRLTPHQSMTIVESPEALSGETGAGNILGGAPNGVNTMYSGYVYNDGTFQYDGEAVLFSGSRMSYQFACYVKGTFSDTLLNIGDADSYQQWVYKTSAGVPVSLALSDTKALVIADRDQSFIVINVLTGTGDPDTFGTGGITSDNLQEFADLFDLSQLK